MQTLGKGAVAMDGEAEQVRDLIQAARQEDAAAIDRLLGGYRNYLRMLAQLWVHRSLPRRADPSDLAQETLIKAHCHFGQFEGCSEAELAGWLRKILARNVLDLVRRQRSATRQLTREVSLEDLLSNSAQAAANVLRRQRQLTKSPSRAPRVRGRLGQCTGRAKRRSSRRRRSAQFAGPQLGCRGSGDGS